MNTLLKLSGEIIESYSQRLPGPNIVPYHGIFLNIINPIIKLAIGFVIVYGAIKLIKSNRIQKLINKV